jgi:hypothetical protein
MKMSTLTHNRINNTQLSTFTPSRGRVLQRAAITPVAHGVLQRCSNGVECSECRAKRERREQQEGTLQHAAVNTAPTDHSAIPSIVHAVLNSPGQPLDRDTQAFMEPRFGHDFSGVRVHTDAKAAESARAVNALAYTVGNNMVFGAGQYAPGSIAGRRLLAHELTHVVQQGGHNQRVQGKMVLSQPGDRAEQEAEKVALGGSTQAITPLSKGSVIQRLAGDLRSSPTPPPPAPAASATPDAGVPDAGTSGAGAPRSGFVCGPDVTTQVSDAVSKTKTTFAGWTPTQMADACHALTSLSTGAYAWDIGELHNNAWILGYRPSCASQGANPHCGSSVQVGADCHYAGSANYVIFGVMCKLCNNHFTAIGSSDANDFTESEMLKWVDKYKGTGFSGLSTPSANFAASQIWSRAGYAGWSAASTPAGDRSNCLPTCPTAYTGSSFTVHWVPIGWF